MVRLTLILISLILTLDANAARLSCGNVQITDFLTGPRHGAMIRVSPSCGESGGWVCLDPNGEKFSKSVANRTYAFVLSKYMLGEKVNLAIDTGSYAVACGGNYPLIDDVRSAY